MIRSLRVRSRLATASTRASAEAAFARVERDRPLLAFARVLVAFARVVPVFARVLPVFARVLPLARLLLALARVLLAALRVPEDPDPLDFALLPRVLRDPLLELDLLDPPLLACGMLPPWTILGLCSTLPRHGISVCKAPSAERGAHSGFSSLAASW
jgi:hypothetical protein